MDLAKKRIGWVMTNQLDTMPFLPRIDTSLGSVTLSRFHWIACRTNNNSRNGLHHEFYRPWKRYDGLIFLKAMGKRALALAERYLDKGKPIIFDANVNYYTVSGAEHYQGMMPTVVQQSDAIKITEIASAVIADSEYIADKCKAHNDQVAWIPDNVEMACVPTLKDRLTSRRLRLAWSGAAIKLFELLVIEEPLRRLAGRVDLVLVTGDLSVMKYWKGGYAQRIERLLGDLDAKMVPYHDIRSLFDVYLQSDVVLSPRFLDNTYNLGHTEWKITLGMACGCQALASPVPSYSRVSEYSLDREIVLCQTEDDWNNAFDVLLSEGVRKEVRILSRSLVDEHYSSRVVTQWHSDFCGRLFLDCFH